MFKDDDDVPEHVKSQTSYQVFAAEAKKYKIKYIRSLVAFFLLGLCNNFGTMVLITAAEDIMEVNTINDAQHLNKTYFATNRHCSQIGTGAILLTFIITGTIVSSVIPFMPWFIHLRIFISIVLSMLGFCIISLSKEALTVALVGVVLISSADVLGECSCLQYTTYFHVNVISTWASGTGTAGVLGALSYTLGVEQGYKYTMLGMTSIPIIMGLVFWFLLPIPTEEDKLSVSIQRAWNEREVKTPWMIIVKKYYLIPKVFCKYIAPLGSVYLFEYFINQGLYELIKVEDKLVEKHMQYQWLQVAYQVGVFVSRSSVNCIYIKYIWIMALFQFFNVIIFTTAAIYMYISIFWVLFALAIEEGLFGGAAYVNTFVRIGREEAEEEKQFMSSMTCFGNNASIMLAGFLAILAHNLICKLPQPSEM
ncbi:battenin-like isoform X1 [Coccinella septempunctata]|uniref:battenin-like isoform X1 n=1 Tax=Coccinella septempunctata TaxID=41139 RepID=UPI001D080021|nr:battenin-like isoform X1 [Coccinella septempunctata]